MGTQPALVLVSVSVVALVLVLVLVLLVLIERPLAFEALVQASLWARNLRRVEHILYGVREHILALVQASAWAHNLFRVCFHALVVNLVREFDFVAVFIIRNVWVFGAALRYAYVSKETYDRAKRDLFYGKGGLLTLAYLSNAKRSAVIDMISVSNSQKRPTHMTKRDLQHKSKETY